MIIGVDSTMEYKGVNDTEWLAITDTQIYNLAAGEYEVRFKADGETPASYSVKITVTDPNPEPDPDLEPDPEPEEHYYIEDLENQLNTAIQYEAGHDTVIL